MRTIEGIKGKVSAFNEKLFTKYDVEGRKVVKYMLGDAIDDNPDIYGEDMIFNLSPFPYKYLEVQVYAKWEDKKFPYDSPYVYARKMRFSPDTLFVAFNKFFNEVIIFGRTVICDENKRLKKYDREFVNFVPWRNAIRTTTDNLSIDLIKDYYGYFNYDV